MQVGGSQIIKAGCWCPLFFAIGDGLMLPWEMTGLCQEVKRINLALGLIHTKGDTYDINSMYIVVYSSGYLAVLLCRVSFFRYLCAPISRKDVALQDNSK